MKQFMRWRYYCDHCKKAGGSKGHIAKHERGCTANPNRVCGLCAHSGEAQTPLVDLIALLDAAPPAVAADDTTVNHEADKRISERVLADLRIAANGCVACMFAAIRQTKHERHYEFDARKEFADWWAQENDRQNREARYA
jgi:hypothetical protein